VSLARKSGSRFRLWIFLPLVLAMGGMVGAIVHQNISLIAASESMATQRTKTLASLMVTEVANVAQFGSFRVERLASVFDDLVEGGSVEHIRLKSGTGSVLVESGEAAPSPPGMKADGRASIRDGDIFMARKVKVRESFAMSHGGALGGGSPGGPAGNPSGMIRGEVVLEMRCSGEWLEEMRSGILSRLAVTVVLLIAFGVSTFLMWRATRSGELAEHRSMLAEQRAQHLAGINLMASGLAHEIKNPIGAVRGFTELLSSRSGEGSEEHHHLLTMMESLDEVNERINRLLSFATPRPLNKTEQRLSNVVSDVLRLIGPDLTMKDVDLETEIDTDAPPLELDAARMKEVILNLLVNALEAIEVGGKIKVEVRYESAAGRHVLAVTDNGGGVPQDQLRHVFDPYFTTKAKGSGLGLAICKRNVENHGGSIWINSDIPKGTTAVVSLPSG